MARAFRLRTEVRLGQLAVGTNVVVISGPWSQEQTRWKSVPVSEPVLVSPFAICTDQAGARRARLAGERRARTNCGPIRCKPARLSVRGYHAAPFARSR